MVSRNNSNSDPSQQAFNRLLKDDRKEYSFEHGGGDDFLLSQLDYNPWKDEMASLKIAVEEGFERFWRKDQVCGFTEDGKRIGTGIPRERPNVWKHEYSL